jgi:regulator of RNase E activity RraA
MATRTQRLGVGGIVVDGQLRDIQYIRSLQLPVLRLPFPLCVALTETGFRARNLNHRSGSRMSGKVMSILAYTQAFILLI